MMKSGLVVKLKDIHHRLKNNCSDFHADCLKGKMQKMTRLQNSRKRVPGKRKEICYFDFSSLVF